MMGDNTLEEILGYTSGITGIVIGLSFSIYVSGFVIVNAFLSNYHIVQVELFQPAFITAGLLYFFIISIAFSSVIPFAACSSLLISEIDNVFRYPNGMERSWIGIKLVRFKENNTIRKKNPPKNEVRLQKFRRKLNSWGADITKRAANCFVQRSLLEFRDG